MERERERKDNLDGCDIELRFHAKEKSGSPAT